MKKLIFGCTLMLAGMIGSAAWLVAGASLVQGGAWSTLLNMFNRIDGWIVLAFFAVAVVGAVIALRALKEEEHV